MLRKPPAFLAWLALLCPLLLPADSSAQVVMNDPELTVTPLLPWFSLQVPTSMAFLGPGEILVLEKETGRVRRILNGVLQPTIALDAPVNFDDERGMLGIAINGQVPPKVFLYYTEAVSDGAPPLGNRVYRYDWDPNTKTLVNPQLILDLPVTPGPPHNGGTLLLGEPSDYSGVGDGAYLYVVIGDLGSRFGKLQNRALGPDPDDTSVIFRIRQDGTAAPGNPFKPYCRGNTTLFCDEDADCGGAGPCETKVAKYFAYGVRNCFGMALDPLTGDLWMSENGPETYDEINRVQSGMNSGWNRITGPDERDPEGLDLLWNMPGAGITYSDPEFSWFNTIGPTGIAFGAGSTFGPAYDDKLLVTDVNFGALYALPLDGDRTGIDPSGYSGVEDLVADSQAEREQFRIGYGFEPLSDLEWGPDHNLYAVSITLGNIYKIEGPRGWVIPVPAFSDAGRAALGAVLGAIALAALLSRRARGGSRRAS
jgi:glucose/arabinose dehydrogenase